MRDSVRCGGGIDVGGDDLIIAAKGRDDIDGERGDDRLDARDGEVDSVVCGDGRDRVRADRSDVVAPDCERVLRER